ncbi:hypothetical protein ACS04_00320 [Streptomyces roseus]|uniref:Secreted protein n=1 Tax=Streptomyces roseus TaxID=66430 RepID=A0A0J6XYD8_9ACTN|nr:hypothetical protein ACS04_00320 [Streptomyces roseus]
MWFFTAVALARMTILPWAAVAGAIRGARRPNSAEERRSGRRPSVWMPGGMVRASGVFGGERKRAALRARSGRAESPMPAVSVSTSLMTVVAETTAAEAVADLLHRLRAHGHRRRRSPAGQLRFGMDAEGMAK